MAAPLVLLAPIRRVACLKLSKQRPDASMLRGYAAAAAGALGSAAEPALFGKTARERFARTVREKTTS